MRACVRVGGYVGMWVCGYVGMWACMSAHTVVRKCGRQGSGVRRMGAVIRCGRGGSEEGFQRKGVAIRVGRHEGGMESRVESWETPGRDMWHKGKCSAGLWGDAQV
eukprot:6185810-Pleurochrysis_carterae.AAC.1